jgi:L-amino acid N-acyltransferase YncA
MTAPALALRPATAADCSAVWAWNFAPDVRAMSIDQRPISLADHARWFADRLAREDAPMWVVEDAGRPIGIVRVDPTEGADPAGCAGKLSIALARDARGRGIGRTAIAQACARWGRPVIAWIRHDNLSSRNCFEACGFTAADRVGDLVLYRKGPP